ncbi:MAG: 50S ribosomal protein L10 [Spirochaetaceae bacterium]|jgi:large subunit ribosomal protein L10|nr:50S ribosomal protein L10 [Spirochaetaceae bacterium]
MAIVAKQIQDSKAEAIKALIEAFGGETDFIFTEYRGLTVTQITELRKQLRAKDAVYRVVKNNFARIAFEELKTPDVSAYLTGPTAIAIAPKDSNEVAKVLLDFTKEAPALQVKAGLVAGAVYDKTKVEAFSKLPGRLELISMLMSVMNGPARNLAAALNDVPARLVRTLNAVKEKKESESGAA